MSKKTSAHPVLKRDGRISSLPLNLILFGKSNAGKTALMRFLGKAMCGADVTQLPGKAYSAGTVPATVTAKTIRRPRLMQVNQCGLPVLYDDVPGSLLNDSSLRKLLIDALDESYEEAYPYHPAIVATTNITPAMPREFRKRALFFESKASLALEDAISNGHIPSSLTKEVGPAFFAEYARRMVPLVAGMSQEDSIDSLDVYAASSSLLMDLFKEAGLSPSWVRPLCNSDYFGEMAECERALDLLVAYYRANPGAFDRKGRDGRLVIRYQNSDRGADKLLKEVANSLPPRCETQLAPGMLSLNMREVEELCGQRLGSRRSFFEWLFG